MKNILDTQIIGDGPAATGLFVAADGLGDGSLNAFSKSCAIIGSAKEKGLGVGGFNSLAIHSNSSASDYLECVRTDGAFKSVLHSEVGKVIADNENKVIDLRIVGQFLRTIGYRVRELFGEKSTPVNGIISDTRVAKLVLVEDGQLPLWKSFDDRGTIVTTSRTAVLATGAREVPRLDLEDNDSKVVLSGGILKEGGVKELQKWLGRIHNPQVVIRGGSHSGFSVAWRLLHPEELPEPFIRPEDITIVHRGPIKIFHDPETDGPLPEQAPKDEICSQTGRRNRFGGLRGDAKKLYLDEKRLQYVSTHTSQEAVVFNRAHVIIQSLGFSPNLPLVYKQVGQTRDDIAIVLRSNGQVFVDNECHVYDKSGNPIPGLWASGIGYGVSPSEEMGGEESFNGTLDAVNLYQGLVGRKIVEGVLHYLCD